MSQTSNLAAVRPEGQGLSKLPFFGPPPASRRGWRSLRRPVGPRVAPQVRHPGPYFGARLGAAGTATACLRCRALAPSCQLGGRSDRGRF